MDVNGRHPNKRLKTDHAGGGHRGRLTIRSLVTFGRAAFHPPMRRRAPADLVDESVVPDSTAELHHKTPHAQRQHNRDLDMLPPTASHDRPIKSLPPPTALQVAQRRALYHYGPRLDPRILSRHHVPRLRVDVHVGTSHGATTGLALSNVREAREGDENAEMNSPGNPLPSSTLAINVPDNNTDEEHMLTRVVSVRRRRLVCKSTEGSVVIEEKHDGRLRTEIEEFESAFNQIDQEEESVAEPPKYMEVSDDEDDVPPVGPSVLKTNYTIASGGIPTKKKSKAENHFRSTLRGLVCNLMGISEDEYPTRDNCPSDEAVSTFARTKNPRDGPRGYPKLLVDIARGGSAGPWNAACVGIVYDEMKQLGGSSMPPWSDVEEAFKVYLRTLRSKYRHNQNGTGPDREESNTLLRMRKRRAEGWQLHLHIEGVQRHYQRWKNTPILAVSPDRPDFPPSAGQPYKESPDNVFIVRAPWWRNPAVGPWFRVASYLQIAKHYKNGKFTRGNLPAKRVRNYDEVDDRDIDPPKRLPVNFYSPAWLTEERRKEYEVLPEFDITLPEEVIRQKRPSAWSFGSHTWVSSKDDASRRYEDGGGKTGSEDDE
ncbi:hypothetical protein EV121DRAFT_274652, partial [Schizophyllum commune]